MSAMFKMPSDNSNNSDKVKWTQLDMSSLPKVLATQVSAIHEAETVLKAMKAKFANEFNEAFHETVPNGMVRRFGYKFDGLSFANYPEVTKTGNAKVQFVAKKSK